MSEETINSNVEEQNTKAKGKHTGAKVVMTAIGIIALVGGTSVLGIKGYNAYNDYKEAVRIESLVSYSIDSNNLCSMPEYVYTNKGYDYEYCDGQKVVDALRKSGADYFYIDGTYYTEDGKSIAILTYTVSEKITAEPIVEEIDGRKYYMAPTGYTLNSDGTCTKVVITEQHKIVPALESGDYSQYGEVINVEVQETLPFSEIAECNLICDVDDNAVANENGMYKAIHRLKR